MNTPSFSDSDRSLYIAIAPTLVTILYLVLTVVVGYLLRVHPLFSDSQMYTAYVILSIIALITNFMLYGRSGFLLNLVAFVFGLVAVFVVEWLLAFIIFIMVLSVH